LHDNVDKLLNVQCLWLYDSIMEAQSVHGHLEAEGISSHVPRLQESADFIMWSSFYGQITKTGQIEQHCSSSDLIAIFVEEDDSLSKSVKHTGDRSISWLCAVKISDSNLQYSSRYD
jgi:hypothetical protein